MNSKQTTIVITGCNGQLGKCLIERFKDAPYQLIGLDIALPQINLPSNFTYIQMDLSNDESVRKAFSTIHREYNEKIASFIHLADSDYFSQYESDQHEQSLTHKTGRILDLLKHFEVEQFIFSSTMFVHQPCNFPQKIDEESPLSNSWDYPKYKILTESLIHQNRGNMSVVTLRMAASYDDKCHSPLLANQIQRIYENQFSGHVFPGNSAHGISYVHLDDVCEAIWLTVAKRQTLPPELTLLVGEIDRPSYDQLQRIISVALQGKELTTYRIPKDVAKFCAWFDNYCLGNEHSFVKPWMIDFADQNYSLNLTRIENVLGWSAKHSLKTALPNILEDLKTDPIQWYQDNQLNIPSWIQKKHSSLPV